MRVRSLWWTVCVWSLVVSGAAAQTTTSSSQPAEPPAETRPATPTATGETGLWFVPTGEVLPAGRFAVSVGHTNEDREAGFSDISHFPATFSFGIADRAEVFASWRTVTRIDRDIRPLFVPGLLKGAGGVLNEYPFVRDGWIGDSQLGDLLVGIKINLLSEHRQQPFALAVRGLVKVPTGDEDSGASTGETDFEIGLVGSKEIAQRVEMTLTGSGVFRDDPEGFNLSNGVRWGIGFAGPTRRALRLTAEAHGEWQLDDTAVVGSLIASDGTLAPVAVQPVHQPVDVAVGLTWRASNGFFIGGGVTAALTTRSRSTFGYENDSGDRFGIIGRIGYHPGARVYVPPPPPPPPPPQPPANRPPTVTARCEPCTVETGQSSTLTADAQDPDGDPLSYRWTAPTGTFASATSRQTVWTAPAQEGAVQVTVAVDDGRGGRASANLTVQVVRPVVREVVFEDIHFDFDRYTLRPAATRALDEVITALQDQPTLRLEVEGHTCNIGTNEYNLALGERRAQAVRDYLASRGIGADRLRTVSYGEERPKHDNAREETRRLNRRAALVVRLQQ